MAPVGTPPLVALAVIAAVAVVAYVLLIDAKRSARRISRANIDLCTCDSATPLMVRCLNCPNHPVASVQRWAPIWFNVPFSAFWAALGVLTGSAFLLLFGVVMLLVSARRAAAFATQLDDLTAEHLPRGAA